MKKVKILGVQFDVVTAHEALSRIMNTVKNHSDEKGKHIVTPNPEMILEAQKNPEFAMTLNYAWLSIPDGIGVLWASTLLATARGDGFLVKVIKGVILLGALVIRPKMVTRVFPERVTGVDLMEKICNQSQYYGTKIFLLGAAQGVAAKTAQTLLQKYPRLKIVGTYSGSPRQEDFGHIYALIKKTEPDILFVAYGAPAQELWIHQHIRDLPSVKIAMGVGGAFDVIAGIKKRAPRLMRIMGIEWLWRLAQEPSRIKRIFNATARFPIEILKS